MSEIIVVSTLSVPMLLQWQNLDATWISRFYETAEEVEPDSISGLREMIRSEQETLNFERYWMGIISECDKRHEIDNYEATREKLLRDLSIIENKRKTSKEELNEISNTQSQIDLIPSQNSENEINTNSGTISDLVLRTQSFQGKINASNDNTNESGKLDNFETLNSLQDRERMPTPTRDDINELGENQDDSVLQGIKNVSISKAEKSIETSSTSQADECINTSTQDDDSYNASNNRSINLGVSSTRKSKEIMYSHARENTAIVDLAQDNASFDAIVELAIEISRAQDNASIDAMVELGIGTSNTSQGEPTLILDDNNQSSNNASIDTMVELGIGTSNTSQGEPTLILDENNQSSNNASNG
ncbi:hypothetical protein C2G38_2174931 [Gigaspora rosea]|uniref:Uncharacterized protein n=1 Tax=Gigaspora rosea TaxID=44941 RepID=A0A397VHV5_9GLOM|nr:hypothetical protein C2G38_2174931 [Gigaspora rosea]